MEKTDMEKLCELETNSNFTDLVRELREFNVFTMLRMEKTEIRHSNALAWLLDVNSNHEIGNQFCGRFISSIIELSDFKEVFYGYKFKAIKEPKDIIDKLGSFKIIREHLIIVNDKRCFIDILLVSKELNIVIAIENKIESVQGDCQLERYNSALDASFKGYDKICIYLSPNEDEIIREKNWIQISYEPILTSLKSVNTLSIKNTGVRLAVEHYKDIIRRYIMKKDEVVEQKCLEIYKNYGDVIELINRYKPDPNEKNADYIRSVLKEIQDRHDELGIEILPFKGNVSTKYTTKNLKDASDKLYYEIKHNLCSADKNYISLVMHNRDRRNNIIIDDKILTCLSKKFNFIRTNNNFFNIKLIDVSSFAIDSDEFFAKEAESIKDAILQTGSNSIQLFETMLKDELAKVKGVSS